MTPVHLVTGSVADPTPTPRPVDAKGGSGGPLDFLLPPGSDATEPPEQRGTGRDDVRLLVAGTDLASGAPVVRHAEFRELPEHLLPGDLLVVNTSGTLPAALDARLANGAPVVVHVSTDLDDGDWTVEIRRLDGLGPRTDLVPGTTVRLSGGVRLTLRSGYPDPHATHPRLWRASASPAVASRSYLPRHGRPIRYGYLSRPQPLAAYQTVYAAAPGSAEMASAGRPFTDRLLVRLLSRGVTVAPLTLHAGVSSLEVGEAPLAERYDVPVDTARLVNSAAAAHRRVVAVGTTVVRALETVAAPDGTVTAGAGWTDLVLGPQRPARAVTGLISGLHAPGASHLRLLQAVAGTDLVTAAYEAAVGERYRWHEFGDSTLFLPARPRRG
jgi:S-adenosylmethionine:tRNA ribosyltransferase-isomerase